MSDTVTHEHRPPTGTPAIGTERLGFYTLGGHVADPRDMLGELEHAERLGLGQAFISERLNVKEACALSGAAGAATDRIGITTAATNINTRHLRSLRPSRPPCIASPVVASPSASVGACVPRSRVSASRTRPPRNSKSSLI